MTATLNRPTCVIGQTSLYLDDLAPQSAAEITERVQAFYRDFPAAARLLQDVRTDREHFTGDSATALAVTYPDEMNDANLPPYHIRLNGTFYGLRSREFFEYSVEQSYRQGWFPTPLTAGTIEHELGHVLDIATAYWDGTGPKLTSDRILRFQDALSIGTEYAQSSPPEAFADAFAAWRLGYPHGDASVQRSITKIVRQVQDHA